MAECSCEMLDYDVVVIGAGAAGLRAAIEAVRHGARTAIICKSLLGKAATVMAEGGIAAATGNVKTEDGWRAHFRDTMRGGWFVNDWRMAHIHAQEAPDRLAELEKWGALFDRTEDGLVSQWQSGGHRHSRLARRDSRIGLEITRALQRQMINQGIHVHMECDVKRLLVSEGRVAGALGYRRGTGELILFKGTAVVLATGGAGRAWKVTSNPSDSTGDGTALALDAGAELVDMEFIQFHPTAVVAPAGLRGMLISEVARAAGGVLRNAGGRRFMFDYVPDFLQPDIAATEREADAWYEHSEDNRRPPELLPPDVIARAIDSEVRAGRATARGAVFLDLVSRVSAECLLDRLPSLYSRLKKLCDIDFARAPIEVAPACHSMLGGVRVEADTGASTVPGLFAAGEVAAGMHGAARLGGNALSEALVFGRRAGLHAAQYCRARAGRATINGREVEAHVRVLLAPLQRAGGENPFALQRELQDCMHRFVGVARTGEELGRAREKIEELGRRSRNVAVAGGRAYNPGWHIALDLHSLLSVSEATTLAAIERKESRGCHLRRDFPGADPRYIGVSIVVTRSKHGLIVSRRRLAEIPEELKRLVDWSKKWLAKKPVSESGAATPAAVGSKNIA